MKRNDVPKKVKHTATAPFVLIDEGPGRVVTTASSDTKIHKDQLSYLNKLGTVYIY